MTLQKKATIVSSSVAAILALVKFFIGVASGSVAIIASAVDSILDLAVSMFNYFAIHNAEKPADSRFNYGRGKIEALAAVIEGTIIAISGAYILYISIDKLLNPTMILHLDLSLYVMIFSFLITLFLVIFLNSVAKKTNSLVIKSDALHYKTDVVSNGAVLLSLVVIYFSDFVLIDAITGSIIAIYIIYSAYNLLKEGVMMLLDRALEATIVESIETILKSDNLVSSYHYLKTRASGKTNFVDVHLVFNKDISLYEAHRSSDAIEAKIMELDSDVEWVLSIHLDPFDDS